MIIRILSLKIKCICFCSHSLYAHGIVGKARWAYLWVLRSAHHAVLNDTVCIFLYKNLSETAKPSLAAKRTIHERLVVKSSSMSARKLYIIISYSDDEHLGFS